MDEDRRFSWQGFELLLVGLRLWTEKKSHCQILADAAGTAVSLSSSQGVDPLDAPSAGAREVEGKLGGGQRERALRPRNMGLDVCVRSWRQLCQLSSSEFCISEGNHSGYIGKRRGGFMQLAECRRSGKFGFWLVQESMS